MLLFGVFFVAISLRRTSNAVDNCCDQKNFFEMENILEVSKDGFCDANGKIFTNMLEKYSCVSHGTHILEILIISHVMKPLSVISSWLIAMGVLQSGMILI